MKKIVLLTFCAFSLLKAEESWFSTQGAAQIALAGIYHTHELVAPDRERSTETKEKWVNSYLAAGLLNSADWLIKHGGAVASKGLPGTGGQECFCHVGIGFIDIKTENKTNPYLAFCSDHCQAATASFLEAYGDLIRKHKRQLTE